METVADVFEHCRWLIEHGLGEEHGKLLLPRIEAQRRIANKEKRKRISFMTDELGYSRFHARHEAWMRELGSNPTLFAEALDEAMKTFDVRGWKEKQEQSEGKESLADA